MSTVWAPPTIRQPAVNAATQPVAILPVAPVAPATALPGHPVSAPSAPGAPATPGGAPPGLPSPQQSGPPPASLAADPAYNAFLNSLGISDADLRNSAALRAGQTWTSEAGAEAPLQTAQANALDRNQRVYNSRGLVNSSDNLNAGANLRSAYADKLAAMRNSAANSVANLYATLAGNLAKNSQSQANTGTTLAGNDFVANTLATSPTGSFATGV